MKPSAIATAVLLGVACAPRVTPGSTTSGDGVPIRYDALGAGDTLVVLIHGWTNDRTYWDPHPATLARRYRVASVDLAGHGESGSGRTEWTMGRFGEDVVAVADALDADHVVPVGFSLGAAAALEAATRLGERAVGVVIVDALHDVRTRFSEDDIAAARAAMRSVIGDSAAVRAFALSPAAPDSLVRRLMRHAPASVDDHQWPSLEGFLRWRTTNLATTVSGVRAPIAAINSDRVPTDVEGFRALAPSFRLSVIPGVGHLGVLWENPDEFDRLLLETIASFAR